MNSTELQKEMEDHLKGVKENLRLPGANSMDTVAFATKAAAHANAALAIAVAVGLSDLELTLAGIRQTLNEIDGTLMSEK